MSDADAKAERNYRLILFGTVTLSLAFLVINPIWEIVESLQNYLADRLKSPITALNFL